MNYDNPRILSFCRRAAVVLAVLTWLPVPAAGQEIDVDSAKEAITLLARFRDDVREMQSVVATPLGPFGVSGKCSYCTSHFMWCWSYATLSWSHGIDFTESRAPLSRALESAERHAGSFAAGYEPTRAWLRGLPGFSARFEEVSTTVLAVRREIGQGIGPSPEQRLRVTRALNQLTDELGASAAQLRDGIQALAAFLQTHIADLEAIRQAQQTHQRVGAATLQSVQGQAQTQKCDRPLAIFQLIEIEDRFRYSIAVIRGAFEKLEVSSRGAEPGLAVLLGAVVNSQTQLQKVLELIEAASRDELGSFLERLHLDNARAQWKSLAEHATAVLSS